MNELIKVTPTEALSLGKAFFESGLFTDIKSAQQAVVKIMAGAEISLPPFASMSGIHIIQGKPTIGAGLIAARIKGSGKYDYRVITQTEVTCSIDFYQGKEKIGNSTFTFDQAKKAGTKNLDKFPANMLFARAISNGVKWYCPDIFAGPVYTPEEMQDIEHEVILDKTEQQKDSEFKEALDKQYPPKPELPKIKADALKKALERLRTGKEISFEDGNAPLYDKLLNTFSFTPEQRKELDAAWEEGCIAADKNPQQEAVV